MRTDRTGEGCHRHAAELVDEKRLRGFERAGERAVHRLLDEASGRSTPVVKITIG